VGVVGHTEQVLHHTDDEKVTFSSHTQHAWRRIAMKVEGAADQPDIPIEAPRQNTWQAVRDFLIRYRVRISLVVFFSLIAEDVLEGLKPHDLTNVADYRSVLGLMLIVGGLGLRSWAAGTLHKATELTTTGPYALIRHPLYAGSFMMMIGFCAVIDDAENIWFVLGPVAFMYVIKLLHEERRMSKKFGARWQEYVDAVPRFIPSALPMNGFTSWNGRQWLANREYQAVAATVLGLVAIEMWSRYL
jgi:protein-S-isoprenylcysteine O-methyltransferase Ste14